MHAPVITETTTTDAESAQALLASSYSEGRVSFESAGDFVFGSRRQDLGELRIDDVRYSFHSEFEMSPLGYVMVLRVTDGEMGFETAGTQRLFRAGDVFLCAQPDEGYRAITRARQAQVASLDLSLLGQVSDDPAGAVRRFTRDALAPEQARLWRHTIDYVTATLAGNEAAASSQLVLGAAGRMLAAATVSAFSAETPDGPEERREASALTVRRAVSFLESNPDRDLGVADIAAACHVSVRALQLAFRRHLDTTPMTYLRRVRLDRARADLRRADPSTGATVSGIAARWGFAEPGRFSGHYRQLFGESPRETLRH